MGKPAFIATPEQIEAMPVTSDRAMAREHGASASTWARIRKAHGIERFRPPTTQGGEPTPWTPRPEPKPFVDFGFWRAPDPKPDCSLAGEAAGFLRRERFHVFNRRVSGGEGWQVGGSVLTECAMVAKAERLGFRRQEWMV